MNQSPNKIQIPSRTKFAVWWIRIITALFAIGAAVRLFFAVAGFIDGINSNCSSSCYDGRCMEVLCPPPMTVEDLPSLIFWPGLFLVLSSLIFAVSAKIMKGGKIAWGALTGVFFIAGCLFLISAVRNFLANQIDLVQIILLAVSLFVIPAFYLLRDKKNYFAAIRNSKK